MNTVIVYGSKYGCTEKCANLLKEDLEGQVELVDAKNVKHVDLSKYNTVIIGGSVYIGKIRKEIKNFITKNHELLLNKRLGLFICGIVQEGDYQTEFNANFPEDLRRKAVATGFFGGEFNPDKAKGISRFFIKKIAETVAGKTGLLPENIHAFAQNIKN